MVFCFPAAHIVSGFAEDRRRCRDIDAIDPGQVGTGHVEQLPPQVELRLVPPPLLEPPLPVLFWEWNTVASVLSLQEILLELVITLGHLLLAKLVTRLFLLHYKQQIGLPMALQAPSYVLHAGLHPEDPARQPVDADHVRLPE